MSHHLPPIDKAPKQVEEMTTYEIAASLRKAAEEIANEGHAGWGNLCAIAADELGRLELKFATRVGDSLEVIDHIKAALADADKDLIIELVNGYIDRASGDLRNAVAKPQEKS